MENILTLTERESVHNRLGQVPFRGQIVILAFAIIFATPTLALDNNGWQTVEAGLEIGHFRMEQDSAQSSAIDKPNLFAIRIDPEYWNLRLLSVTGFDSVANMSVKEWAKKFDLTATINAGMYDVDYKSHTGYMKIGDHINCSRINKYQSALAFDPVDDSLSYFRIFDLDETPLNEIIGNYKNVAQNLRLIKRPAENRWTPGDRKWSEAALAEDTAGRILFLYAPMPLSMYEFNEMILSLPLGIVCAQHLEGGAEAQIYLDCDSISFGIAGNSETDYTKGETSLISWPTPNVLGISRKK